ncbi:hypothetical protein A2U01_0087309, partial [Trifolium medium]|nr:hypothetical protein [Trifolium medium]
SEEKLILASSGESQRAPRYLSLWLAQRPLKNRQARQGSLQARCKLAQRPSTNRMGFVEV